MRIQVGREINPALAAEFGIGIVGHKLSSGNIRVGYKNLPKDGEGWINASTYLPIDYELVCLKLVSGVVRNGWWGERKWFGLRLKPKEKVYQWKFINRH